MKLIDCSYFYTGPLQIENARSAGDLDNNAHAVQECIEAYIERYQGEFLTKMVGTGLRATIEEHLANLDTDGYSNDALEDLCSRLRLSFAHYIYFKLAGDANLGLTVTGLMQFKSANTHHSPRQRMVRVWNDMVVLNIDFVEWAKESVYDVFYYVDMVTPINQYNL